MELARDRDVISGAVLAALGAFILYQALGWAYLGPDGPGPGFFPVWYGVLMIVLSLYLVLKSALRPDPQARTTIDWHATGRALATWAMFAGSIVVMEPLGFVVAFGLLAAGVVWLIMGKSLLVATATSVCMSTSFWVVFSFALGINLPEGRVWAPLLRLVGMN